MVSRIDAPLRVGLECKKVPEERFKVLYVCAVLPMLCLTVHVLRFLTSVDIVLSAMGLTAVEV